MIWHALVLVGSSVAPLFLAQRYHAACVKLKLHAIRSSHAILRAAWTLGNVGAAGRMVACFTTAVRMVIGPVES
jgi:hypothetical protein